MGIVEAFSGLGLMIGPMIGSFFYSFFGYFWTFLLFSIFMWVNGVYVFFCLNKYVDMSSELP